MWNPDDIFPASYSKAATKSKTFLKKLHQETSPLQWSILAGTAVSCFALGVSAGRLPRFWRRYPTVLDIPKEYFSHSSPWFRGRVISVTDGDTIRVLHVPTLLHSATTPTVKLSESTWNVRLCTIDAPETAKFGNDGQSYGQVATEHLQTLIQDRFVQVRLLDRDQYGRAVAEVRAWKGFRYRYLDEVMLRAGLAEVYEGSSAVYGRLGKEKYLKLQESAKRNQVGMWSLRQRESAAEYKARTKR